MMSSYTVLLVSMVMMAVSIKAQLTLDLSVTSCSQYNAVQRKWAYFNGISHIRRFIFPDLPMTCGYVQIGYPGEQTGILSTGVSFLTVYNQATNTSTIYNYTWTGSELVKGKVVQLSIQTNIPSLAALVAQTTAGYCVISCPIFDLSGLKVKACSLSNTMYCCTYDQFAPESEVDKLMSAARANGVDTYGAIATDQSSCPTTVNQYPRPPFPTLG